MQFIRRTFKAEKEARQFMAIIQVILVQKVVKMAEKEGKEPKEAGVLALIHGIALLFFSLERAEHLSVLEKENVLRLKEQIIMVNMNFAFGKKGVTEERTEEFTKLIYEVLKQTGLTGGDKEEIALERIYTSLCETLMFRHIESLEATLSTLQEMVDHEVHKISRLKPA